MKTFWARREPGRVLTQKSMKTSTLKEGIFTKMECDLYVIQGGWEYSAQAVYECQLLKTESSYNWT